MIIRINRKLYQIYKANLFQDNTACIMCFKYGAVSRDKRAYYAPYNLLAISRSIYLKDGCEVNSFSLPTYLVDSAYRILTSNDIIYPMIADKKRDKKIYRYNPVGLKRLEWIHLLY